jgi:CheY-like chemotaxis protein
MMHAMNNGPRAAARILIVEDDRDSGETLARLLKIFGYEVVVAREGSEAIAMALGHRPDFILLDIGLPGMNGYEVARRLRSEETCRETVIIAVTGYGQPEDRQRSREVGIDYHLLKPIEYGILLALFAQSEELSAENGSSRHPRKVSTDGPGRTVPARVHDTSQPGSAGPREPGVPTALLPCLDWRGCEAAGRPVPSGYLGDRWDR